MSHTHWDREWYHTAERFRQRLVDLIDELLDNPGEGSFLLDGQTVVLEDYLDVRPERAGELAAALKAGRLEAGPWFVLPDELIPSGEGLVRNLLAGARTLRGLRAESPPVLYCPDSFGHPAALPALALGFGKQLIIVWRGHRGEQDTLRWEFGGDSVVTHHLSKSGYELGANLPADDAEARTRWGRIHAQLAPRATTGVTLLLNGADHHARQRDLPHALDALRAAMAPDELRRSTLGEFAGALLGRTANLRLERHRGELRDSYGYTWTLQGTLATRAHQKRRYAKAERALVRDVEPWAALARLASGKSHRALARMAWRDVLLCQPHDTLCGCSIDAVARAMDARLESAESQVEGLRESAVHALIGHDAGAARLATDSQRPVLLVRNAATRKRSGVAMVEIDTKVADAGVGPGSRPHKARKVVGLTPLEMPYQVLGGLPAFARTEAPRAYPDNDAVLNQRVAVWVENVPGYAIVAKALGSTRRSSVEPPMPVSATRLQMSNGIVTLKWTPRGEFTLADAKGGRTIRKLLTIEDREDAGDLYTPAIHGPSLKPKHVEMSVVHNGPLHALVRHVYQLRRADDRILVVVWFSLDAGSPFVRCHINGLNEGTDHRLRAVFRTDVDNGLTVADAAFGRIERTVPRVPKAAERMEKVIPTAPQHRYVTQFGDEKGVTIYSDGLAEYESMKSGIAVTLLRAVGELSRANLKERPGHAGWPEETWGAQCKGNYGGSFAVLMHGPRSDHVTDAIERIADDVLSPLTGETLSSALRKPDDVPGIELEGAGLAFSAAKESEDGEWVVLRCVNLLEREVLGAWRVPQVREARLARLDETPGDTISPRDGRVEFTARGREVVTILVR